MSLEVFELIMNLHADQVEKQLAIQCAPLISGIKISNLLCIPQKDFFRVRSLLENSSICMYPLVLHGRQLNVLLYESEALEEYLNNRQIRGFLKELGYDSHQLQEILPLFRKKYQSFMKEQAEFPHEMGILLGYPLEDVRGFMTHKGKHSLCNGYWKVYHDVESKQKLFESYRTAERKLVHLLAGGKCMEEILRTGVCFE